jgi:hypothetical protein
MLPEVLSPEPVHDQVHARLLYGMRQREQYTSSTSIRVAAERT